MPLLERFSKCFSESCKTLLQSSVENLISILVQCFKLIIKAAQISVFNDVYKVLTTDLWISTYLIRRIFIRIKKILPYLPLSFGNFMLSWESAIIQVLGCRQYNRYIIGKVKRNYFYYSCCHSNIGIPTQ